MTLISPPPRDGLSDEQRSRWNRAISHVDSGDFRSAIFLLNGLAKDGIWPASLELGQIYMTGGDSLDRDLEKAKNYYQQAVAAANDPIAKLALAILNHETGDFDKAYNIAKRIEHHNQPSVYYLLGVMYSHGQGVEKDKKRAMEYFRKGHDIGHILCTAALAKLLRQNLRLIEAIKLFYTANLAIAKYEREPHGSEDEWKFGIVWKS